MEIPFDLLDEATLKRLIEEFVTRDGTELSDSEKKIEQVIALLKKGDVYISFDQEEKTTTILAR